MKYNISYDGGEYNSNHIVKALNSGAHIQFHPKGYSLWVDLYPDSVAYLSNGQLNFVEYDFRIMTPEFADFLRNF